MKLAGSPVLSTILGDDLMGSFSRRTEALGESIQARALRNAYALGMADPVNLTFRRNSFSITHNRHTDTVEAYENEMILELIEQLLIGAPLVEETFDAFRALLVRFTQTMGEQIIEKQAELRRIGESDLNPSLRAAAQALKTLEIMRATGTPEQIGEAAAAYHRARVFANQNWGFFLGAVSVLDDLLVPVRELHDELATD